VTLSCFASLYVCLHTLNQYVALEMRKNEMKHFYCTVLYSVK